MGIYFVQGLIVLTLAGSVADRDSATDRDSAAQPDSGQSGLEPVGLDRGTDPADDDEERRSVPADGLSPVRSRPEHRPGPRERLGLLHAVSGGCHRIADVQLPV